QKRRAKKITVLIVPEENVEPISFRLRKGFVKFLYGLGLVILIHSVLGGIAYWKYAKLLEVNENLVALNERLQEDNKRVVAVAEDFFELERKTQKIHSLLGVETEVKDLPEGQIESRQISVLSDRIVPAISTTPSAEVSFDSRSGAVLLTSRQSKFVDYPENMPTLVPVKGFITMDFDQSGWFANKNHSGIDIVAKKGTVIRAAGAGVIIFANWTFDLGNLIIIDHGGGLVSYYGHTQRMLQPEKTYVKKGDPIALLGSSGKSSGPHLHFEIRRDGVPIDPKSYVLGFEETIRTNHIN
ncbi:M23 family metallopeptidase, partial [bacterium]|nr:M23 family metallopeptidase [bacterium]